MANYLNDEHAAPASSAIGTCSRRVLVFEKHKHVARVSAAIGTCSRHVLVALYL
jgi:hypothetical protein